MKEILFISGKGGTGKTSLTASFIELANDCIACDYDVDASNLPLLLKPKKNITAAFSAGYTAVIDETNCIICGLCKEICRFEAIDANFQVTPLSCEGCGFCEKICPVQAISMHPRPSGHWFSGEFNQNRSIFYADLRPGEENSGKLVAQVKTAARGHAAAENIPLILADGPPGIGCAVISSMVEVDLIVLVAEPGKAGFHDLQRVFELIELRGIKAILIINKWDLNPEISREIEIWAREKGIELAGKVPFSTLIADAVTESLIPASHPEVRKMLFPLWENINNALSSE